MFKGLKRLVLGGAHKIAKQFPSTIKRSEVSEETKGVIQYLSLHEDQPISIAEIARGSDLTPYHVQRIIRQLVENRIIVKSETKRGQGTRYWLVRGPHPEESSGDRLSISIRRDDERI